MNRGDILLEQVEIGSNIVPKLIEKGQIILQLYSTKPREHKNIYNSAMATCDVPASKGGILQSSCIIQINNHLCCWYKRWPFSSKGMSDGNDLDKITTLI